MRDKADRLRDYFYFVGNRDYIHSSTIIASIQNSIDHHPFLSIDIKFKKPISNEYKLITSTTPIIDGAHTSCSGIIHSEHSREYIYLIESTTPITSSIPEKYQIPEQSDIHNFEGRFTIDCSSYNRFITNIIESNKILHKRSVPETTLKITNLYMNRVPLTAIFSHNETSIIISNLSYREINTHTIATLNQITLLNSDIPPIEISFLANKIPHEK